IALPRGHSADIVADALAAQITELPEQLGRSLTWDQGKEMADHARFSITTGVPVYFCDPRSPWQRGSNENTNGLLRQYFPKRSDIRPYDQAQLVCRLLLEKNKQLGPPLNKHRSQLPPGQLAHQLPHRHPSRLLG